MGLHAKKLVCTGLNYCMLCSIHFISLHIHSSIFLFICDDSSLQSNFFFCWIHQIEFLLHLLLDSIYYLLSSSGGVALKLFFSTMFYCSIWMHAYLLLFFGIELESVRRFLWFLLRFWVYCGIKSWCNVTLKCSSLETQVGCWCVVYKKVDYL